MCIAVILCVLAVLAYGCFTLDAGLLASSQNPEGPATGYLKPGFLGFPVSKSEL
jgi:hypothetical protein